MPELGDMLFERFRLVSSLGEGGMGRVWCAYDTRLHRQVAVKEVILPSRTTPTDVAGFYRRVVREARNAAKVGHVQDVVTVLDVVEDVEGRPWIVMELMPYPTLEEYINQHGVWAPGELGKTAGRLLAAVNEVHCEGIVHRDFKPANLMVRRDKTLVVLDFGIARYTDDTVTIEGLVGSPAFMAPEYLQGGQPTAASDAWSLGVVFYFALTGTSPFERYTTYSTIFAVLNDDYPPLVGAEPIQSNKQ